MDGATPDPLTDESIDWAGETSADGDDGNTDVYETDPETDGDFAIDPVEDSVCETGETRCEGGRIFVCSDGAWMAGEECPMGCTPAGDRCLKLDPSNADPGLLGLGDASLRVIGRYTFNTDSGLIMVDGGDVVRPAGEGNLAGIHFSVDDAHCNGIGIFSFANLSVEAGRKLEAVGGRGLVILVSGQAEVSGQICGSATFRTPGAGGYSGGGRGEPGQGPCGGHPGAYYYDYYDSGAGGGGHLDRGGIGGAAPSVSGGEGGMGGSACNEEALAPLCGGSGGAGCYGPNYTGRGSEGGAGGGVVQVSSGAGVYVRAGGSITTGGGGGSGGHPGGGGGGGAGGSILIEAPTVEMAGSLSANGGGGGSGGYSPYGLPGNDGDLGGAGGTATAGGSAGGNGGALGTAAGGAGSPHGANAGGGGGSAGRIRINTLSGSATITGTTSPTLVSNGLIDTF